MTDFETVPAGTMAEVERLRARVSELEGRKHFASALADQASAAIETTIAIAAERDSLRARAAELERAVSDEREAYEKGYGFGYRTGYRTGRLHTDELAKEASRPQPPPNLDLFNDQ